MRVNTYFHFKQFSVQHHNSAMKVGTDGVLLGAWAHVHREETVLDAGTGTGLIALMLAQRTHGQAIIDAVEINALAAADARENFKQSPWVHSLNLAETSLQHVASDKSYDLIISNPPYFINSLKPPDTNRGIARHADTLTTQDLLIAADSLLNVSGRLALILPYKEGNSFRLLAAAHQFQVTRQCLFYTRSHKPPERWLLELSRTPATLREETLILYEKENQWSEAYINLTKDFYLNL